MDLDKLFQTLEENMEEVFGTAVKMLEEDIQESVSTLKSDIPYEEKPVWLSTKQRKKAIIKGLISLSRKSSVWQVFSDWVAIMALLISNIFDPTHKEHREAEMVTVGNRYTIEEAKVLLGLFVELTKIIISNVESHRYIDILGEMYMELGLASEKNGQYFTPVEIASVMGRIAIDSSRQAELTSKKFITISEPTSGSGAMLLGTVQAASEMGINPACEVAALAVDTDIRCIHMCYIQMSLYGIPAVVQHGDSLSLQEWSRWYTPTYIVDDWVWRAKLTLTNRRNVEDELLKCLSQPMYGLLVYGFNDKEGEKRVC